MALNKLPNRIVFYDGECGLCNHGVQFLLKKDKSNTLFFSALQDELGQEVLTKLKLNTTEFGTFIYLRNGNYLTKSTAALYAFKDCKNWISLFFFFIIVPKLIRDWAYSLIAKNRHRFVKQEASCWFPTNELKKRFI